MPEKLADLYYATPGNLYQGMPLEALAGAGQELSKRYDEGIAGQSTMEDFLGNMKSRDVNSGLLKNTLGGYRKQLDEIAARGNYEDAKPVIHKVAQGVSRDDQLKAIQLDYANDQAMLARREQFIKDGGNPADYDREREILKHKFSRPIQYNQETGMYDNVFSEDTTVPYDPKVPEKLTALVGSLKSAIETKVLPAELRGHFTVEQIEKMTDDQIAEAAASYLATSAEVQGYMRFRANQDDYLNRRNPDGTLRPITLEDLVGTGMVSSDGKIYKTNADGTKVLDQQATFDLYDNNGELNQQYASDIIEESNVGKQTTDYVEYAKKLAYERKKKEYVKDWVHAENLRHQHAMELEEQQQRNKLFLSMFGSTKTKEEAIKSYIKMFHFNKEGSVDPEAFKGIIGKDLDLSAVYLNAGKASGQIADYLNQISKDGTKYTPRDAAAIYKYRNKAQAFDEETEVIKNRAKTLAYDIYNSIDKLNSNITTTTGGKEVPEYTYDGKKISDIVKDMPKDKAIAKLRDMFDDDKDFNKLGFANKNIREVDDTEYALARDAMKARQQTVKEMRLYKDMLPEGFSRTTLADIERKFNVKGDDGNVFNSFIEEQEIVTGLQGSGFTDKYIVNAPGVGTDGTYGSNIYKRDGVFTAKVTAQDIPRSRISLDNDQLEKAEKAGLVTKREVTTGRGIDKKTTTYYSITGEHVYKPNLEDFRAFIKAHGGSELDEEDIQLFVDEFSFDPRVAQIKSYLQAGKGDFDIDYIENGQEKTGTFKYVMSKYLDDLVETRNIPSFNELYEKFLNETDKSGKRVNARVSIEY